MNTQTLASLDLRISPRDFRSVPFWVWNDLLTTEQIDFTFASLQAQHIRALIVHPRPGLVTPYLSEAWFELWQHTLTLARQHGFKLWIYDENSYPSGFAGGHVPQAMPESRALGLKLQNTRKITGKPQDLLALYRRQGDEFLRLPLTPEAELAALPEADYRAVWIEHAPANAWYGGRFHVDLLRPGVTEKFLEVTLDPYRQRFGDEFGRTIVGVFTDEPHLNPCGQIHWTPDFAEQYHRRWSEDFWSLLPWLWEPSPQGAKLRYRYFCLLNELFVDRWAKPYFKYCQKNKLELTGHYWEHGWPKAGHVPDNMAMSAWQQRPGIDILFNDYQEGPQAQFGNVRAVIELASVANQTGATRTLCETYGGSGAEMTFEDYKRIGDWTAALGVNTMNEHLSHISLRGWRKRDYPPTISYHAPWMEHYHSLVDYWGRVMAPLAQGQQRNHILLLEPTTTTWMLQGPNTEPLLETGRAFQRVVVSLAQAQVEFDLGCEHILQERGAITKSPRGNAGFTVGKRTYDIVVLPAEMRNLNRATFNLLNQFLQQGGRVLALSQVEPSLIDGAANSECDTLRQSPNWQSVTPESLPEILFSLTAPVTRVVLPSDNRAVVYHHRRQLGDGEILFVINTSKDVTATGKIRTKLAGIRQVCLQSGDVSRVESKSAEAGFVESSWSLPPCGSAMFYLDQTPVAAPAPIVLSPQREPVELRDITIERLDDNHLLLDYVDVTAGSQTRIDFFVLKAAEFIFKANGKPTNPWQNAVQFRDEILQTRFALDSGFSATYSFHIAQSVPVNLHAAIERADLYHITCNGIPVTPTRDAWWLDRSCGKVDLSRAARVGVNRFTLTAAPMTVFHELEAAHLLGDFSVVPASRGFVITPATPMKLGAWCDQGLPMYGHRVSYAATVQIPGNSLENRRVLISLNSLAGVVAQVRVNGTDAGLISHQPLELDITAAIRPGSNRIEVIVVGSLRNVLGPHLGVKALTITSPWSWGHAPESPQPPGSEYFAVPHGLNEMFKVTCVPIARA